MSANRTNLVEDNGKPPHSDTLHYRSVYNKLMSRIRQAVQDAEEEMKRITR